MKIRELEEKLLQALSNVRGNILDDDHVMSTLENLKKEADVISKEAAHTEEIMQEVIEVTNKYLPLAIASSRIYFAIESLTTVHFLYHFSLGFFMMSIFDVLIKDSDLQKIAKNDPEKRLELITHKIFTKVYGNISRGLLECDKLVFALKLLQIRLTNNCEEEIDLFMRGNPTYNDTNTQSFLDGKVLGTQAKEIIGLAQKELF